MANKKIEVVEIDKNKEQITLEEKKNPLLLFYKKHQKHILFLLFAIVLLFLLISGFIFVKNINKNNDPQIKKVTIDTTLNDYNEITLGSNIPITEETAQKEFMKNTNFKPDGIALTIKVVDNEIYQIKFYSDGTALKILKKGNLITRIAPLKNGQYGISEDGITTDKTISLDIKIVKTKEYKWGKITYFSDNSAEITNSNFDIFVRNSEDINENYISNNKVAYLKETKKVGNNTLNYYYDGTIEIINKDGIRVVRNLEDIEINGNNIAYKNNNTGEILKEKKLSNNQTIYYLKDGGAIIKENNKLLSIRKSNSIVIKNNKIFEIVDNIYVEIANNINNGNVIYYTNGGAVFKYQNEFYYTTENSNIKYDTNKNITTIQNKYEELSKETNNDQEKIKMFKKHAVVEKNGKIVIVPKSSILFDKNGLIKDFKLEEKNTNNTFSITNNSNKLVKYRVIIESSEKTDLDDNYIKYQLKEKEKYYPPQKLNANIWRKDNIYDIFNIKNTKYILVESELEPFDTSNISLMIWTDYNTIPNSMQNKYFYGTIKVFAWTEK